MAKTPQASYGIATGYNISSAFITQPRDPTPQDVGYDLYQGWVNTSSDAIWVLMSYTSISGTVQANWETISGSTEDFEVDASTSPGTNPVEPDAGGTVTVTGGQVTSGTVGANVIRTNSLAENTYTIQVQQSGESAAQDTTLNGVCHFDSSHFNVTNGFVTLSGGGMAVDSFTTNVAGPVVPNAAGAVLVNASTSTYTDGATANTLKTEVQGTNHAVFVGQGTNTPATTIPVGTTGQLLVGATGADPAFASTATGDFTFTSATAAQTRIFTVSNTDNTAASDSGSRIVASVGGTTQTGDAYNLWSVGSSRSYSLGPDTSDSQTLKLTTDAAASVNPSSGTLLASMTSTGQFTLPLQPFLLVQQIADVPNATGAGDYNFSMTEIENQNPGSYVAGVYTIPSTGNYIIFFQVSMENVQSDHTDMGLLININGLSGQIVAAQCSPANCRSGGGGLKVFLCQPYRFTAGDTVSFTVRVINGSNVIQISGSGGGRLTIASLCRVS